MKLYISIALTFLSIQISYGQLKSTHKNVEQRKDSAFTVLFNALWAELEITTRSKDTTIILTEAEKVFYYSYDTLSDASLPQLMVIPVSKYARVAARYFELKTSMKPHYAHNYFPTPYLTYNI